MPVDVGQGSVDVRVDQRFRSIPLIGILLSRSLAFAGGAIIQLAMMWWVLQVHGSPILLSVLAICMFLPMNIGIIGSGLLVGRFGARRLLLFSKLAALLGAITCTTMLAVDLLTIETLLVLSVLTYGAMAPSITADISRVPVLTQFAGWRIATFHAANYTVMISARLVGFGFAGVLVDRFGQAATVGLATVFVAGSLAVTAASFPRDSSRRKGSLTLSAWLTLTQRVVAHEAMSRISLLTVIGVALLMAIWATQVEVLLPLTVNMSHLPATVLSAALAVCALASMMGAATYRFVGERIGITRLARRLVWVFPLTLMLAASRGRLDVIAPSTAVCAATGAFLANGVVTTLQREMPTSLQAQMIGLWRSLSMLSTAMALLVVGALASISPSAATWTLSAVSLVVAVAVSGRWPSRNTSR